jgi:7-cyano-7-deazaguanine synthase
VHLATELPGCMEALAYSHTCYAGRFPPCGECHACVLRAHGFAEANISDPLIERARGTRT